MQPKGLNPAIFPHIDEDKPGDPTMVMNVASEALARGLCLQIRYNGFVRVVEVHAVGVTTAGNDCMRVWQIRGGSNSGEPIGWKMLKLDGVIAATVLDEKSQAPRPGYKPGDKGMARIFCEL